MKTPAEVTQAFEAADYLLSLYERLWKGGVVRDLAEAIGSYNALKEAALSGEPHTAETRLGTLPTDRHGENAIDRLMDTAENAVLDPQLRDDLRTLLIFAQPPVPHTPVEQSVEAIARIVYQTNAIKTTLPISVLSWEEAQAHSEHDKVRHAWRATHALAALITPSAPKDAIFLAREMDAEDGGYPKPSEVIADAVASEQEGCARIADKWADRERKELAVTKGLKDRRDHQGALQVAEIIAADIRASSPSVGGDQ